MIQKKKLILFTNSFPYGNSEPYLQTEIPFLVEAFDEIFIFPLNIKGSLSTPLHNKIKIIDHSQFSKPIAINYTTIFKELYVELPKLLKLPNTINRIKYFSAYLTHKYKLAQIAIECAGIEKPKAGESVYLYSYWFNDLAVITSFIKQRVGQCISVSRAHGFDLFEEQSLNHYIPYRQLQFKYIDKIVSVSKRGEIYLKRHFPKNGPKISVSYLGTVNSSFIQKDMSDTFTIATCSIIRSIKRLDLLVEILKNVVHHVVWHVIGNGHVLNDLKEKCRELPAHIHVVFHDYLSQTELYEFYKNTPINLFCSVSSSEGLPVSIMEAISFGIPVMSTDVGGCSEICNEKTGFLIPKDFEPKKVAAQMDEFRFSEKNTLKFRSEVKNFWETNFSAHKNYPDFVNKMLLNNG
ncbi:MAG: glycosyltransferase [Bacteroidota bacterium]